MKKHAHRRPSNVASRTVVVARPRRSRTAKPARSRVTLHGGGSAAIAAGVGLAALAAAAGTAYYRKSKKSAPHKLPVVNRSPVVVNVVTPVQRVKLNELHAQQRTLEGTWNKITSTATPIFQNLQHLGNQFHRNANLSRTAKGTHTKLFGLETSFYASQNKLKSKLEALTLNFSNDTVALVENLERELQSTLEKYRLAIADAEKLLAKPESIQGLEGEVDSVDE